MNDTYYRLLSDLTNVVIDDCGPIVRNGHNQLFETNTLTVNYKEDNTPVTSIDYEINDLLMKWAYSRGLGYVGEEGNGVLGNGYVLYVDSLDGTIGFTRGMNTCTIIVTIMKMRDGYGTPVATVLHQPLSHHTWTCLANETTRYMNLEHSNFLKPNTEPTLPDKIRSSICVFPGASHNLEYVSQTIHHDNRFGEQQMGAFGIGAGLIASNILDVTAIAATAATESASMMLIVNGAGGVSIDLLGNPLSSFKFGEVRGKPDFTLPNGGLFASNQLVANCVLEIITDLN